MDSSFQSFVYPARAQPGEEPGARWPRAPARDGARAAGSPVLPRQQRMVVVLKAFRLWIAQPPQSRGRRKALLVNPEVAPSW